MQDTPAKFNSVTEFVYPEMKPAVLEDTLAERGNRYGAFVGPADVSQALKQAMHNSKNWDMLQADQTEALEMIVHKIARILNGDPNYADSWHDIGGYAKLVEDRLNGISR